MRGTRLREFPHPTRFAGPPSPAGREKGKRDPHVLRKSADRSSQVGDLRRLHAVRDPSRCDDGDLRHPRRRGEAQAAAFRRPAVPRCLHVALSARGLSRALRHRCRARHPPRQEADRAQDPDHHRGHELRLALGQCQGGARARRHDRRHVDDHRRRRHVDRGARPVQNPRLPISAVALRHEPRGSAQGRRDRDRRRAGRQARRRRHAARPEDHRPRRQHAHAAQGHRPALGLAAIRTGPDRTISRSRSSNCARSPTGRRRSTSRSAARGPITTSRWR